MVLGDLRSCIHLVYPHLFDMVFEVRRVFAGPVLTDSSPGLFLSFSLWEFGLVVVGIWLRHIVSVWKGHII